LVPRMARGSSTGVETGSRWCSVGSMSTPTIGIRPTNPLCSMI
jgi:hypothetical protein